jgi:hypothetical protein
MLPKWHALFGFVFAFFLVWFFNVSFLQAAIVFFSSVLIDVDHYINYILHKKNLDLRKAYKFFIESEKKWFALPLKKREKYQRMVFYFHGIEFLILIFFLSLMSSIFIWIFLGIIVHLIIDLIELEYYQEPLYSKGSQVYVFITNKNKKKFN